MAILLIFPYIDPREELDKIEETSIATNSTNFKLKISNKLPEMTVDSEKQANILKLIFSKNFENNNMQSKFIISDKNL